MTTYADQKYSESDSDSSCLRESFRGCDQRGRIARGDGERRECTSCVPNEKSHLTEEPRVFTGARPIPFRVLYTTHSRRTPRAGAAAGDESRGRAQELKRVRSLFPVGTETTLQRLVARRPNPSWTHANFDLRNCHRSDALARNRALASVVGNKLSRPRPPPVTMSLTLSELIASP